ncbi:MAG: hypothetical protein K6E14_12995 [Paludibacteraceae bacterium]|nr:hypothetical protein [Paludibacteraceae bacterium]
MKYRVTYIILFLFAFLFQLNAQLQYVDYEYVDGTKEREAIDMRRITFQYCYNDRLSYRIKNFSIDNVFDTIRPMDLARNESRKLIDDVLHIKFRDGEPVSVSGPFNMTSMGGFRMDSYGFRSDKKDADNGIMSISFYSYELPDFAYHNGKQISSISGRISYFKFKTIKSTILNDDLAENLNPFYLAPITLTGSSDVSDASYIKFIFSTLSNELAVARVTVINNLKRMGYTLTSQKGVFPLIYQNQNGNTILMYETYIMVKVKD